MSLWYIIEASLGRIFRLEAPKIVRDRPLQVLALGLSRCGTESLKFALEELGYNGVYDGVEVTGEECMLWTRLWDGKQAGSGKNIGVEDFDRLIGKYEAVTDAPSNMFSVETIRAYPDAKVCCPKSLMAVVVEHFDLQVILNRRKDVDAWDRSFRATMCKGLRDNWFLKSLAIFSPQYFWLRQITMRYINDMFNGNFEKNGRMVYHAHYRQLEETLGEGNYLSWTVEDGWYVNIMLEIKIASGNTDVIQGAFVCLS